MAPALQHSDWLNGRVPDEVRRQLRSLVEVVGYLPYPQPLGVVTGDAVLLAANRPLLDLLGASGDEVLGVDWDDFMPGWSERVGACGEAPGGTPGACIFSEYLLRRGGDPTWVSVVASPVFTPAPARDAVAEPDEALAAWALFVVDYRPRAGDAEERRRREILELLLESPSEFVVQLSPAGRVEFLSTSLRRALGMPETRAADEELAAAHGLPGGGFGTEFEALLAELGRPPFRATVETVMATRKGDVIVSWEFESLLADGGEVKGILGVGRDVTERRQAEESVHRRLELETLMSSISARFAGATRASADAAIDSALMEVGRESGASRMSLYELGKDGVTIRSVRAWRRERGAVEPGRPAFDFVGLPWLRQRLAAREVMSANSVDDFPPEAAAERAIFEALDLEAVLLVPIVQDDALLAFLALDVGRGAASGATWEQEDRHLLCMLADRLAGILVWNADEANLRAVSECFLDFGPDMPRNLERVCRAAADVTGADLVLYSRLRGESLVTEASWGGDAALPLQTPAAGRICSDAMERADGQVLVIGDLQDTAYADTSPVVSRYGMQTYVGFPVSLEGQAVATLSCLFACDVTLRESQLELLRVLGRAAAVEEERGKAIDQRLQSLAQLELAMERTVGTLSGAMSARDPYTAGHERRVAELAAAIGTELGLGGADVRLIRLAGLVHDIGKISVPAELLSKPSRLSDVEFDIIKGHAQSGWELLEPAGLPGSVTDAVLHHHERLDGRGYPDALAGDDIAPFARILAVADVVEAMSSDRPYRPSLGIEPALEEIAAGRGLRYDERAVDACLRLFRDEGFSFVE